MRSLTTIGYEGADVGRLIEALKAGNVQRVIDVRAVPMSRKKGFSKHILAGHLLDADIRYTHFKALGTPKAGREAARAGDIEGMTAVFARQMATPDAHAALDEVVRLATTETLCLLCFEADAAGCHRHIVADAVAERTGQHVQHLHPLPGL